CSVSFLGIGPGCSEDGFGLGVVLERGQPANGLHAFTGLRIPRGLLQGMTKRFVAALRSGAGWTRKGGSPASAGALTTTADQGHHLGSRRDAFLMLPGCREGVLDLRISSGLHEQRSSGIDTTDHA